MESLLIWGLLLLGIAAAIVVIEFFVPSGGLLGLTALTLAIAGVVCLFRYETVWGLAGSAAVLVGGPALFALGFKIMPHTPVGRRLILGADRGDTPPPVTHDPLAHLVGMDGTVVSDLRPVGVVRIDGKKYDAVSETTLIRAGSPVKVASVEGLTLRVRPLQ